MRKPTLLPAPTEAEDLAAHDAWIDGEGANVATTTGIWFAALAYARGRIHLLTATTAKTKNKTMNPPTQTAEGHTPKPKYPRYFARDDDAVRNGSFTVIRRSRTDCTRSIYMNGDFVQGFDSPKMSAAWLSKNQAEEEGLKEYLWSDFKTLAPKCVGGKGGAL